MNMQQLRYARALAEFGSFVQAANHCGVTQPTLSNGIAELERELGQQLFARTTRKVCLTKAGLHLLPDIADVLNAQTALVARAKALSNPAQRLMRIGVSPVVGIKFVALVIEPFRIEYPDIEIVFREMNLVELVTLLEGSQLDFVFGPVDKPQHGKSNLDSASFHSEPLVFVPSSSTKKKYVTAKSISLKEISGESFVMVPDSCGLTRTTRALFKGKNLKLKEYSGKAMGYGVLQEWAELGIGSAILPRSKLNAGNGSGILITEGKKALEIRYRSLWQDSPNAMSHVKSLAQFLKEVAPSIAQGLAD